MKSFFLIFCFITLCSLFVKGQTVSCSDLTEYVKHEGLEKEAVQSWQLLNSSWLQKVTEYIIEDTIFVIAEIYYDNGFGRTFKEYIFCGVPASNWNAFYNNEPADLFKTYGEKFRKYIFDYKCNCY